jgi:hypothetical protein
MAGFIPAIHVLKTTEKDVDARDKRGHDELNIPDSFLKRNSGTCSRPFFGRSLVALFQHSHSVPAGTVANVGTVKPRASIKVSRGALDLTFA